MEPTEKPAATKPVIKTAVKSKSAWAQVTGICTLAVSYGTDWLQLLWHVINDFALSMPMLVGLTGATVSSAKEALSWFDIPWSKVGIWIVTASMVVVLVRHIQDKRRVPWD